MNDNLFLNKKINFSLQYVNFLQYMHPHFEIIDDLSNYDNPCSNGIIYIGQWEDLIENRLNSITNKWIIVNQIRFDVDLSTNENLLKNVLPLHYVKIKNDKDPDKLQLLRSMNYSTLLDKIKISLIDNSQIQLESDNNQSIYSLFCALLGTPDILAYEFFNLVNKDNIAQITSSVLTFLNKVQSQNIKGASNNYARLIVQSNKRYGKHIKKCICSYVKSKADKILSLYNLLISINKAR